MINISPKRGNISRFTARVVLVRLLYLTLIGFTGATLSGVPASAQTISPLSVVYVECVLNGKPTKGSGVVIDVMGRLLTSEHVVRDIEAKCTGALGTQSDPAAMKQLDVKFLDDFHDVALLQFVENPQITFLPVPYDGTDRIKEGVSVVGYGYHPNNTGAPERAAGEIKSTARSARGQIEAGLNTTPGMSGGPVVLDGRLIGIIASEDIDRIAQAIATQFVAVDEFPNEILRWLEGAVIDPALNRENILTKQLAANDVCTQILREQIRSRGDRFPRAAEIAALLIEEPSSHLTADAEYWVTVTTGPAEWVDCRSGNMLKAMYFPMGMMVRPERDVTVDGATRTVFLTEHGMRVFLEEEAIAPVTEDIGYVFAIANGAFKVCTRDSKGCDPYKEYRVTEHDQYWPFISGYQSYLRSDNSAEIDTARTQLEALYDYQQNPPDNDPFIEVLDLDDPASLDACAIRSARLYNFFRRYDSEEDSAGSEYFYPVLYSLCTVVEGRAYNRFQRTKLVTKNFAEERFSQLWAVNTVRTPPDNVQKATKALFGVESPFVEIIKCGEARDGVFTLGSISKAEIADLSQLISDDKSRYSIFRQFQIAQAQSPVDIFNTAPLFNDIELSIICDEQDGIRNAGSIIIDLAPLSDGLKLELVLFDLFEVLKDGFENLGMVNENTLNKRLREGVMYRICEYHEYVVWRTILFNEIKDSELVRQAKDIMGVDLDLMADHITHLIMASVFSTDTKLRNSGNRRQGCE